MPLLVVLGASTAEATCGGLMERACCNTDPAPNQWPGGYRCAPGFEQINNCTWSGVDDCSCPGGGTSPGRCYPIAPCGGLGQRKCCSFEGHCNNSTQYCHEDADCPAGVQCVDRGGCNLDIWNGKLEGTEVCSGDCTCGDWAAGMGRPPSKSDKTCYLKDAAADPEKVYQQLGGSLAEPETGAVSLQATPNPNRRGFADMHVHLFGNMASGAGIVAGAPYDRSTLQFNGNRWTGGVATALKQCAATTKPASPKNDFRDLLGPQLDLVQKFCEDWPGGITTDCEQVSVSCDWPLPSDCGNVILHGVHGAERVWPTVPGGYLTMLSDPIGEGTNDRESFDTSFPSGSPNLGWPLFNAWPTYSTTTHEQTYYKWLERAWRGGLRLIVQLAVTNEALCKADKRLRNIPLYSEDSPGGRIPRGCEDSMASIDAQIDATKDLEQFIDEQSGGDGWFKIVYTPEQADAVIAQGKLAVVLGIEVDNLFNCKYNECTADYVRQQVDAYYAKGVRHVFPIHNFENAFGAPAIWTSPLLNAGNWVSEGAWWPAEECAGAGYTFSVHTSSTTSGFINFLGGWPTMIDLAFGYLDPQIPSYPDSSYPQIATCHQHGLSVLGEQLVQALMDKGMLIDIDHMSNHSIDDVISIATARGYPIVAGHVLLRDRHISDASQADYRGRHERMRTLQQLQQIKALGGMIALMTNVDNPKTESDGEAILATTDPVQNYMTPQHGPHVPMTCGRSTRAWAQSLQYAIDVMDGPVAMGTDFNGLAGHLTPRFGDDACFKDPLMRGMQRDPLAYPFTLDGFGEFGKQTTALKEFDFNVDGLAHVGLLPDMVADLQNIGPGDYYIDQLLSSADAYVGVWRRGTAVASGCSQEPLASCLTAGKAKFFVSSSATPAKNKLIWKWGLGDSVAQPALGTPDTDTAYALCIYDHRQGAPAFVGGLAVRGPDAGWQDKDPKGWKYKSKLGAQNGVTKLFVKTSADNKSKALIKAKGINVPALGPRSADQFFDQDASVTVQLVNGLGTCWTSDFVAAGTSANGGTKFKAKNP